MQDRHAVAEGKAEIERQNVLHIEQKLNGDRLVEAEPLTQLRHIFRRCRAGLARQHVGGVTRRQLPQEEVQDHDAQKDWDRLRKPPNEISDEDDWRSHKISRFPCGGLEGALQRMLPQSSLSLWCVISSLGRPVRMTRRSQAGSRSGP